MASSLRQAAIFIDVENVQGWIRWGGLKELFATLVSDPELDAAVVYRRAYATWSSNQFGECLRPLNQWGFEMINVYHPVKGKNSADIQIVVDAMEVLDRRPDLVSFVLVTGDSDFSPLFRRLRERGKVVVGVGPESSLSETVKSSCNRFIYTDRRERPAIAPAARPSIAVPRTALAGPAGQPTLLAAHGAAAEQEAERIRVRAEAARLVRSILPSDGAPIALADLKNRVLKLDSAFDQKIPGTFLKFLRSIPEDEWRLKEQGSGNWTIAVVEPEGERDNGEARPDGAAGPATREQYESFLRQKSWRFTTRAGLAHVYRALASAPDWPGRGGAEEQVLQRIDDETLSREAVSDAVRALFAVGACERVDPASEGHGTYRVVRNLSDDDLVRRHDVALLSRLDARCREREVEMSRDIARLLLLGTWDDGTFDVLTAEARQASEAHRAHLKAREGPTAAAATDG